jgi:RHS repeat-associated protein
VHGNRSRNYSYDDNGNFTSFAGQQFTYKTHNNQLINDGTRQFSYDAIGRAVTVGSDNIEYDVFSNMTGYNNDTYTYDADNQRIKKVEDNDTTYYIRDGLNTLAEYDGSGNHLADYVYGISGMAAKVDLAAGYFWYYKDHLGSTRQLGSSNLFRDYYPFGMSLAESGTETRYLFTGKEFDGGTGLTYFGVRYYDARIGRWLVVDPAGQYWSPYVYCGNNPVKFIDNDGEFGFLTAVAFVIGFGVACDWLNAPGPNDPVYQEKGLLQTSFENALITTTLQKVGEALFGSDQNRRKIESPEAVSDETTRPIENINKTIDSNTGEEVGRFIADSEGNTMIEPKGGDTVSAGRKGTDTHTLYDNKSNYQRLNPQGHPNNPTPHGHGHLRGAGPNRKGQGPSISPQGEIVKPNDPEAHWPLNKQ